MKNDVELMRAILFVLESYQVSPRAVVVVSIDEEAVELGCSPDTMETSLNTLLDLDYIDGPGLDEPGYFLFRKLTRKAIRFLEATERPADWERMKRHFAPRSITGGA